MNLKNFSLKKFIKTSKKGFTLIEILIVIAIIGVLTVALLPRLQGAQASARNTARKADLNQIATALAAYNGDNGAYPEDIAVLAGGNGYLKSLPKDPASKVVCGTTEGKYFYSKEGDGYVLAAYMEKQPGNPNVNNIEDSCDNLVVAEKDPNLVRSVKAKYVIRVEN